jgi:hypothetical protein
MNETSNRGSFTRWEGLLYFLVPAAIAIATGRGVIDRILSGGLFNPDSYMRLVRIEEMLQQHRILDVVTRDASGAGSLLHWSHLLDSVLCLLALPLTLVLDQRAALHLAASLLGPISMGLLGIAVAWAASPLAGRRWLWLAPVATALPMPIVSYGLPGVAHHHVLLVLVAVMTNGWALRVILGHAPRPAGLALGTWAAIGIWLSPETMPFILMAFTGLWLAWLGLDGAVRPERRDIAAAIRSAGLAFLLVLACAFAVDPPYAGYGSVEIDRLSVVYIALALITFALSLTVPLIERLPVGRSAGAIVGLMVPAAGIALWLALFPAVIRGPGGLMSAQEAHDFIDIIIEMRPVTTVTDAVQYLLTGSVVAALLVWIAIRWRSLLTGYAGLCAMVLVALGVTHLRFAAYPCAAAAVMLPIFVTRISASLAERSPLLDVGARYALILVFIVALRVGGMPGLATPAKASGEPALPNCEVSGLAPMLAPYAGQVVLANVDQTPELLYRTQLRTVGSLYHRNVDAFLRLRAAWRSLPSEGVPDAVRQTRASLVLFCHTAERSPLVEGMSLYTLYDKLDRGEVPTWLTQVAEDKRSGNVLYQVMR